MNGRDVSQLAHEEAVDEFLRASEPIVVEVKRRKCDAALPSSDPFARRTDTAASQTSTASSGTGTTSPHSGAHENAAITAATGVAPLSESAAARTVIDPFDLSCRTNTGISQTSTASSGTMSSSQSGAPDDAVWRSKNTTTASTSTSGSNNSCGNSTSAAAAVADAQAAVASVAGGPMRTYASIASQTDLNALSYADAVEEHQQHHQQHSLQMHLQFYKLMLGDVVNSQRDLQRRLALCGAGGDSGLLESPVASCDEEMARQLYNDLLHPTIDIEVCNENAQICSLNLY